MADGDVGQPVENAVIAGELREEHHAGEEEIDVESFGDGVSGEVERDKAEGTKEDCSSTYRDDFRQSEGAQEHKQDAERGDGPDEGVREQRWLLLLQASDPGVRAEKFEGSFVPADRSVNCLMLIRRVRRRGEGRRIVRDRGSWRGPRRQGGISELDRGRFLRGARVQCR